MIIFTPNTVIKSTEVNSNFEDVETRLQALESPSPMVFAHRPNGVTATIAGPAILICSTAVVNVGSCYNTTTGVFTANKAGNYFVNFTGFKNADTTSGQLSLRKNNAISTSSYRNFMSAMGGSYYVPIGITAIVPLVVNDTLDIYIESGLTMHTNQSSQLVIMYVSK